ncbi:MAG TPA: iron-sulfur cluster insertion protein ErpA [Anaerolineales bacterium]|nr:iron-sulfur cluster insertion protein ErpA [Anaerolineales bacterium]
MEAITETGIVETATQGVTITQTAAERVQRLMEERSVAGHALRVFVSGGGCSGLQYGMALESQPRETDMRFSLHGVDVVVDPVSIDYLMGATIDYVDDLMGGGFRIENPNAVTSCGCGHSFRTKDHADSEAHAGGCDCH